MQISSLPTLRRFADELRIIQTHTPVPLAFDLDALSQDENAALQVEVNRLLAACGCGTGATFSIVSAVLYALAVSLGSPVGPGAVAPIILGGLGTVVLAGSFGKLIGIMHARLRLRRLLSGVLSQLEAPDPHARARAR